jgi:hypothetical protein
LISTEPSAATAVIEAGLTGSGSAGNGISAIEIDSRGSGTVSGNWRSYNDGGTLMSAGRVDVDHVVALANAWRSGGKRWTRERRRNFGNDLEGLPAHRCERGVEPLEGRPGTGGVDAAEARGVVPLLALVGAGEATDDSRSFELSGSNSGAWWRPAEA